MSVQPVVQYASRTDVGMRRSANQDSLAVRLCAEYDEWATVGHLFVVADGMGGHAVGDLASRITVETLPLAFAKSEAEDQSSRLTRAIEAANRAINDKARENPEFTDMGTTCSVLSLSDSGAWVGHVGDSRVYRVRDEIIEQLTFDHSLQWEMVRQGRATAETSEMLHPRNVITRCLGPDRNVEIDVEGPFDVRVGDRFLLCSDGLTGHVTDQEIGAVTQHLSPADASRMLVDLANSRGGSDNTTVVIAAVDEYPPVAGATVDAAVHSMDQTQTFNQMTPRQRSGWLRISMAIFGVLALAGLVLMMIDQQQLGFGLVCGALLLGFIQLIMSTKRNQLPDSGEFAVDRESAARLGVREPAARSPYRRDSAEAVPEFLDLLVQTQEELTAAAVDNGWELDRDELSRLAKNSAAKQQANAVADCLRDKAKALRILMKEFSGRLRPRG